MRTVLLVLVGAVAVGGYVVMQIGIWKAFIALFRDQRRRGWFK
jgi:hypothetical protein